MWLRPGGVASIENAAQVETAAADGADVIDDTTAEVSASSNRGMVAAAGAGAATLAVSCAVVVAKSTTAASESQPSPTTQDAMVHCSTEQTTTDQVVDTEDGGSAGQDCAEPASANRGKQIGGTAVAPVVLVLSVWSWRLCSVVAVGVKLNPAAAMKMNLQLKHRRRKMRYSARRRSEESFPISSKCSNDRKKSRMLKNIWK